MCEADLPEVIRIEAENFSIPWTEKDFRDFIDRNDADFLIAQLDGGIVGYIGEYGIPNEGDITNVSVDHRFRRLGIGELLVDGLIHAAADRGITKIFLEVRESNEAAIALYRKFGFTKVGVRKNYYKRPLEDGWIMMREEAI